MPFSAPLRVTVEIRLGDVDEGAPRADVTRFFRCSEQIALPPRLDLAHGLPIAGDAPARVRFALPAAQTPFDVIARVRYDPEQPQRGAAVFLEGLAPEQLEQVEHYIAQRNLQP
ncbi:MAG: hypothetical protein KC503_35810 [Myxococcales bacterium]|nr:hypothetical protein [Myxococcales bacterium]